MGRLFGEPFVIQGGDEMKVAIYARVSTPDGRQTADNQLLELRHYRDARQWAVAGEYVDHGSGAKERRPELDRLLADAKRRRFDAIVCWRLDRFGRSLKHLINGCRNIGVLSDIGYRHLNYIRDMRNWASAAHPNQVELSGLQLVGWLDTCVREVLGREPSAPAIEVKRLLENVRTQVFAPADVAPISARMPDLPPQIVSSLLRAIAGMFADPGMAASVKNNIRLIAPAVWEHAPDQARHDVGLKYSRFAANADIQRRDAVRQFLTIVNGLTLLTPDALALEITERVQALENAHLGFNNVHNEPVPARAVASSIPESGAVPDAARPDYVRVVTLAHIGNPYGVSWAAELHYQRLIARFGELEIRQFARLVQDATVAARLRHGTPAARFRAMAGELRAHTADPYTQSALDVIADATPQQLPNIGRTAPMRQALEQMGRRPVGRR